jgi:hypothetical protein
MHSALPYHFYIWVDNKFLGSSMPKGLTKGILHGFFSRPGQLMSTHVQLETGAHWSGLPLHALKHKESTAELKIVEPWGCMGNEMEIIHFPYLEGLVGKTLEENLFFRHSGIIVDWKDGYSRYPQEHKPLSFMLLSQGNFALLPNNYFKMLDKHFTDELEVSREEMKSYKRGEVVYWEQHGSHNK